MSVMSEPNINTEDSLIKAAELFGDICIRDNHPLPEELKRIEAVLSEIDKILNT